MRVLIYVVFLAIVFLGLAIFLGSLDQILSILDYADRIIEQHIAEIDPSQVVNQEEKLLYRLDQALANIAPFIAFASMIAVFAYLAHSRTRR